MDQDQKGRLVTLTLVGGTLAAFVWWALAGKRTSYLEQYQSRIGEPLDPLPSILPQPPAPDVPDIIENAAEFFQETA